MGVPNELPYCVKQRIAEPPTPPIPHCLLPYSPNDARQDLERGLDCRARLRTKVGWQPIPESLREPRLRFATHTIIRKPYVANELILEHGNLMGKRQPTWPRLPDTAYVIQRVIPTLGPPTRGPLDIYPACWAAYLAFRKSNRTTTLYAKNINVRVAPGDTNRMPDGHKEVVEFPRTGDERLNGHRFHSILAILVEHRIH